MFDKFLDIWLIFGLRVTYGYGIFSEKIGLVSIVMTPIYLLGFVIPWFMVTMTLIGICILYGHIVYGMSFKEQWCWFKEGVNEGLDEFK